MLAINRKTITTIPALALGASLLLVGGCSQMNPWAPAESSPATTSSAAQTSQADSYYPTDFRDLLMPNEMEYVRDNSMLIKTDAFFGGILNFAGRVEVSSLTNFFIASMVNNQWKMTGSLEGKTVLLSFTKPQQTCMINIVEGDYGLKTIINVYITKDLSGGGVSSQPTFNQQPTFNNDKSAW